MRVPPLLLVALLLAGCSLPAAPEQEERVAPLADERAEAFEPAPRVDLPALAVAPLALRIEERWIRPDETVRASVAAAPGALVDWSLANRNPIRHDRPALLAVRVQPDARDGIRLAEPGRHVLVVGGAPLAVSIVPGDPAAPILVTAEREGDAWRVRPHEARGGPGSLLTLQNWGDVDVLLERVDLSRFVGGGPNVTFVMPAGIELGEYDLVAVARWPTAVAQDSVRLIYDSRKPARDWEAGPWRGEFTAALLSEPAAHPWEARYAATGVRVDLSVESGAPMPPRATLTLVDEDGAEIASGGPPGFDVPSLAAGNYTLLVRAEEGALVAYEASMRGSWVLLPPDSFFKD